MLKVDPDSGAVENVSIFDLADGAVHERANLELERVMENIRDLNTDYKKPRTLTVTFTADEDRETVRVSHAVTSKLAPLKPMNTTILLGYDGGKLTAVEQTKAIPGQLDFNGGEQSGPKVINIGAKRA